MNQIVSGKKAKVKAPGRPLNVRTGPGLKFPVVKTLPNGTVVTVYCQSNGQSITGPFGTGTLWNKISKDANQFISDTYTDTGTDGRVAPDCTAKPAPNGPSGSQAAARVTPEELRKIAPTLTKEKAAETAPHLSAAMVRANINTALRKAMFIAQLAHESGAFRYSEEIASGEAYEGRKDLGNTRPGDGRRFKGRGYIQLTGRSNYTAAGKALGLDLVNNPKLAAQPANAALVAAWYWSSRKLNPPSDANDIETVTKLINGGLNGLRARREYYQRAKKVFKS